MLFDVELNDIAIDVTDQVLTLLFPTVVVSDTIAVLDNASTYFEYGPTLSDTADVSDLVGTSSDYAIVLTVDQLALLDEALADLSLGFTDEIDITDELLAESYYDRYVDTDNVGVQDNVTGEPDVWWNDSLTITDSTIRDFTFGRNPSDAIFVADKASTQVDKTLKDTVSVTDVSDVDTIFPQDTIVVTDQLKLEGRFEREIQDPVVVTESLVASTSYDRRGSDALIVSDEAAAVRDRLTNIDLGLDNVGVTDQVVRDFTLSRDPNDNLIITDQLTRSVPFIRAIDETVVVADAALRTATFNRALATDTLTMGLDSVTVETERGVSVFDTVAVTEQLLAETSYRRLPVDTIQVTESLTATLFKNVAVLVSDTATINEESVLAEVIGQDVDVEDALFVSDYIFREANSARSANDVLTLSDAIEAKLGGEVDRELGDTIAVTDSATYILQPGTLADAVLVSDLVTVERVTPLPVVMDADGLGLTVQLPQTVRYDGLTPENFHFHPLDRGVPIQVAEVKPVVTEVMSGLEGAALDVGDPNFFSTWFVVKGSPAFDKSTVVGKNVTIDETLWAGDSYRIDVNGPNNALRIDNFDGSNHNQYLEILNGSSPGIYRVAGIPNGHTLILDRPLTLVDPMQGKLEWRLTTAVSALHFRTSSKITNQANYDFLAEHLIAQAGSPLAPIRQDFYTSGIKGPKVLGATIGEDGALVVEYDQEMRADRDLVNPTEYLISGPTSVTVQKAWSTTRSTVALEVLGLKTGSYTLQVNTAGTPHDIAGNPVDPSFSTIVFTGFSPLTPRSVFTDKGPIAKPGLTLQAGYGALFNTITEVTLPGATLSPSHVGMYVKLGAMGLPPTSTSSVAAGNVSVTDSVSVSELLRVELSGASTSTYATTGGIYQIVGVVSATRVRLQASFNTSDPASGALYWELINPRNGEIADDPSDVVVKVNGQLTPVEAVVGLLGQVVLAEAPLPTDDVKVDYSWVCNPTVEFRRLNSREFRLNSWNNDAKAFPTKSQHRYRYNNTLIRPSDYAPLDMLAKIDQPEERELHYRAYERAYTPVLNDPATLLLNSPIHKIAFPSTQRTLVEQFVNYEGTTVPQNDSWETHGTGTASVSAGVLTVEDTTSGPFPVGQPFFWTRDLDLTFQHAFAMSWRFYISAATVTDGVFTGVAAGYADDKVAYVVGFLEEAGVKKIGFLKRGFGDDPSTITSWTGGVDGSGTATGQPADFDWSILHSYRIFRDLNGNVRLFVDGDVVETLRIAAEDSPFLEELNAPFDEIQGVFFGSLSRQTENESKWDFVRYLILPTNPLQTAPSSFATYEADVVPEEASKPWTPIGFHGTETILSTNVLLLDSTSATDAPTAQQVGLMGGDFKGFVRMEPLLTAASSVTLDFLTQLRTFTHGVNPYGHVVAVDDGARLMQVAFFPHRSTPKLSYGGRSLPTDFSPYAWSSLGTAAATMAGRILQITDDTITDGRVFYIEDLQPVSSDARVVASTIDYIHEFRCRVISYTPDGSGFAGAFGQVFDGTRAVGVMLLDNAGTLQVALHADGAVVAQFDFDWDDGEFHTYRISKSTTGDLVTLFVDSSFVGTAPYSSFAASGGNAQVSFGSSTSISNGALSVVDWVYCNAWRVRSDLKHYVGFWKGQDSDTLVGYHLPLKTSGRNAQVSGNALGDPLGQFVTHNIVPGDQLIVDFGPNKGVYEVAGVAGEGALTIVGSWPLNPTLVDYRIARETDWTSPHKYRILRGSTGQVSLFYENDQDPLLTVGYNSIDLPPSGSGIIRTLTNGLPAIAFGSFDPENLEQTSWDFVRYGITRTAADQRIAPHHPFLNQWNVMESPERLYTGIAHSLTSFKSSSTGIAPKKDPDFLTHSSLRAFTVLNDSTPLVPSTQNYQVRSPHPIQVYNGSLNNPEDTLNAAGDFVLNDASFQIRLVVPDDVLYSALDVIEQSTGEEALIAPFGDCCGPDFGGLQYVNETCLVYDAEAGVLPENDNSSPTPWAIQSDTPSEVSRSMAGNLLSYGSTGSRTVYKNKTTLPDAPGLQTEARFRFRVLTDQTLGVGDTKIRVGLSAPGMTVGLAFVTTPLSERYVLALDLNNGNILGSISFDYLDGGTHEYVITRDPGAGVVRILINPGQQDKVLYDVLAIDADEVLAEVIFAGIPVETQDTISVSDQVLRDSSSNRTLFDTLAITDTVSRVFNANVFLADALTITEEVEITLENSIDLSDVVTVGDSTALSLGYSRSLADTIAPTDSVSITLSVGVVVSDTILISESLGVAVNISLGVSDTLVVTDNVARMSDNNRTLADTLTIGDSPVVNLDKTLSFSDALAVNDLLSVTAFFDRAGADALLVNEELEVDVLTDLGYGTEAYGFDTWGG